MCTARPVYQPGNTVRELGDAVAVRQLHAAAEGLALGALDARVCALRVAVPDVDGRAFDRLAGIRVDDGDAQVERQARPALADVAADEVEVEVVRGPRSARA